MTIIIDGTTGVPVSPVTGTLAVLNGGTGVTTSTGSGANVLGTSPSLTTPALGTPASGVLTNCTGVVAAALPAGSVLQVVHTNYTSQATSTSATPASVSGFSATITPRSASNYVLIFVTVMFGAANDGYPYVLLLRGATSIGLGSGATGNKINTFLSGTLTNASASSPWRYSTTSKSFLDSPATTSATTYQIQLASPYNSIAGYINRQSDTSNNTYIQFPASTITLMEIQG